MRNAAVVVAISGLLLALSLVAQTPAEGQHAPDGGTREMLMSIFIPPVPNHPFTTTLNTEWVRKLEDGSTLTLQNHRAIMRDSAGRIFQERCALVPAGQQTKVFRFELLDPIKHEMYFCNPYQHICQLRNYFAPAAAPVVTGPANGSRGNFTRENLGTKTVGGVEAVGTRETTVVSPGAIGNSHPMAITKEFWYSPELGINLVVNRADPRHGTENFEVHDLSLTEPDTTYFSVPPGYKVVDLRKRNGQKNGGGGSAPEE